MSAQRAPRSPNGSGHEPTRSVRISNEKWERAKRRAASEGMTMSAVMVLFIEGYGNGLINPPKTLTVYSPSS